MHIWHLLPCQTLSSLYICIRSSQQLPWWFHSISFFPHPLGFIYQHKIIHVPEGQSKCAFVPWKCLLAQGRASASKRLPFQSAPLIDLLKSISYGKEVKQFCMLPQTSPHSHISQSDMGQMGTKDAKCGMQTLCCRGILKSHKVNVFCTQCIVGIHGVGFQTNNLLY